MFDIVLPHIFYKESQRNGNEKHEELPEIMRPFFPAPMAIGV
jgi:hypothetical protein